MKDFPHRAFPDAKGPIKKDKGKGKGREVVRDYQYDTDTGIEDEEIDIGHRGRGPGLHLRHLGVLTAILHRCLMGGDIARASRAWAILIREQFWERPVDIKNTGYWAVGAELLIRSEERHRRGSVDSKYSEEENGRDGDGRERRWGSAEGWKKARAYYEQLILQYPYRRQFQRNTNALDFWPAMVGCEIYGIQWEEREGLRKLEREERGEDEDENETGQSEESEASRDPQEDMEIAAQHRIARLMRKREGKMWQAKEEIRVKALGASEAAAARLDTLMSNHPYINNRVLLRLRAMLALYIGDLSVPVPPIRRGDLEEGYNLRSGGMDSERRLLLRQKQAEYEKGKERRKEQRTVAKGIFNKIEKQGGWVGGIPPLDLEEGDDLEEGHKTEF